MADEYRYKASGGKFNAELYNRAKADIERANMRKDLERNSSLTAQLRGDIDSAFEPITPPGQTPAPAQGFRGYTPPAPAPQSLATPQDTASIAATAQGDIDPAYQPIVTQTPAPAQGFRGYTPPAPAPQSLATPQDVAPAQTGGAQFGLRPYTRVPDATPAVPLTPIQQYAQDTRTREEQKGIAGTPDLGTLERTLENPTTPTQQYAADTIKAEGDAAVQRVNELSSITENFNSSGQTPAAKAAAEAAAKQAGTTPTPTPAGPGSRVFTDAANAGKFPGSTIVTYDDKTGNVYQDAAGNAVDVQARMADQGPRPSFRGNNRGLEAFTPSQTPGLLITDNPVAVSGGGARTATFGGPRDVGVGGAGTVGGAGAVGGAGTVGGGEGQLSGLQARRAQAYTDAIPAAQAAYDALAANPDADPQELANARLNLSGMKADLARTKMGEYEGGDNTAGDQIMRRRDARIAERRRRFDVTAGLKAAEVGATNVTSALDQSKIDKNNFEMAQTGLGIDFKSAMDESGNPIAGGLITWKKHNLAVPAEKWNSIQRSANAGGAHYRAYRARMPEASEQDVLEAAMRGAIIDAGGTPNKK